MASDDEKLAKARRLIGEREFNEARWTLDGLNHPDAAALRAEAMNGLVELNLEAAVSAEALATIRLSRMLRIQPGTVTSVA